MKDKYFRYSLVALILVLGYLIVNGLWQFVNGLLGAFTIYVLVRGQMAFLTDKKGMKNIPAATLILLEVFACVFVPLYFLVWMLVGRIHNINLDVNRMIETVQHFIALIREQTGYDVLSSGNVDTMTGYITKGVQFIIGQVGGLVTATVVMLFVLYFMLIDRKQIEAYVYSMLPFNDHNKSRVMSEIRNMVHSNTIGIPLLAVIQGFIAFLVYWPTGVPSPVLFGVITAFASIVPIVGTGIVWCPLAVYLALTGNWLAAAVLTVYCAVILINIDNVIRFVLQKKIADTHPLITVFGVILGLKLFGFWGIVFGPLLLSMFFLLINIFKRECIDG